MKHSKILSLLAVASVAMLALVGSASATSITTPTGTFATPTIHAVNENGHFRLGNVIATIECSLTVESKVEGHGSGVTAKGNVSRFEFTGCTNSWHVTTNTNGSLEIHWTSGYNGTLTSSGLQFDATRLGVTCVYDTLNTPLGIVTGGSPATVHIEGFIPLNSSLSSGLCGSGPTKGQILGSLVTTGSLYIDS